MWRGCAEGEGEGEDMNKTTDNIREQAKAIRLKYEALMPEWMTTDSPLKYVSWAMEQAISKSLNLAKVLNMQAGQSVFEIGPGAGYLLHILDEDYLVRCYGCDIEDRPLYKDMHKVLGIENVRDERVYPSAEIWTMNGKYDIIVATQISAMDEWKQDDVDYFIRQCNGALNQYGRIVLFPNPKAFKGKPIDDVFKSYRPAFITLPYLGNGVIINKYDTPPV